MVWNCYLGGAASGHRESQETEENQDDFGHFVGGTHGAGPGRFHSSPVHSVTHVSGPDHLSTGHIGRVFRRTVGITLEEFLIRKRMELSKRTLLDPRLNRAEVAEHCGFCNPAYFASVFKKYVKCSRASLQTNRILPSH